MKAIALLISSVIVIIILNVSIFQKQRILKNGEVVYLQLVPVDPRSLMQGDYMRLGYDIENKMQKSKVTPIKRNGLAVITMDENNVAHFTRFYDGKALSSNEKLVRFHYSPFQARHFNIKPNSYFFQEGLGGEFQKAKYGLFHYNGNKDYLLVGLADEEGNKISPFIDKK